MNSSLNILRAATRHWVITALAIAGFVGGQTHAATMQLASTNVTNRASVAVPVTVNNSSGALGGYAVTVSFDTNVVRFASVSGGSGQFATAPALITTNVPGKIRYVHQQTTSITAPTGTVVVSKINFTAIGAAGSSSAVRLSNASADNTAGQAITITSLTDGAVQVGAAQQLTVNPASRSFGTIATGTTAQVTFTVSNTGQAALSGSASVMAPFGIISGSSFNLAGGASTNVVVRFTPPAATSYSANVIFTSTAGSSTNSVTGTGAIAPVAAFSGSPTLGTASLPVSFTDSSSGTITSRQWNFGDGTTTNITATSISHTYAQAGSYTVGLTVTGPVGTNTLNRSNYITVTNIVVTTYTINTSASPVAGGSTSGGGTKPAGESVTVTATTNPGYTFVNWTENGSEVSTATSFTFTASANRTLVANFRHENSAVEISAAAMVTNALLRVGNTAVVLAGETNVFDVGVVVTGEAAGTRSLYYTWQFGDGAGSDRSTVSTATHVYPPTCSAYQASVTVDDGVTTAKSDCTVSVACELKITKLQAKLSFAQANGGSCSLKGTMDLPAGTELGGKVLTLDISGAQVSFTLDSKGRGVSNRHSCRVIYNKQAGNWAIVATLRNGNWGEAWAAAGLEDATIAKPGESVKLTAVVLLEKESFAGEKSLVYTAKEGVSGSAK